MSTPPTSPMTCSQAGCLIPIHASGAAPLVAAAAAAPQAPTEIRVVIDYANFPGARAAAGGAGAAASETITASKWGLTAEQFAAHSHNFTPARVRELLRAICGASLEDLRSRQNDRTQLKKRSRTARGGQTPWRPR